MISKSELKIIKSLQIKKFRREHNQFLVQGEKSVLELAKANFQIVMILVLKDKGEEAKNLFPDIRIEEVNQEVLTSVSSLKTNTSMLAVVEMKANVKVELKEGEYVVVLDDVRDPGNLGTIIRTCDWYGIKKIVCSETCADFYNPKVISSSMGSFTRVQLYYTHIASYLEGSDKPVYGAFMDGKSVHSTSFSNSGYLILGNESNGISRELEFFVTDKVTIPRIGEAESLNVGVATAIILDNIYRAKDQ